MKAKLLPLNGKHYGSVIEVTDGDIKTSITVWCNANFIPSDRELADLGLTRKDWDTNAEIDDGWGGKIRVQDMDICSDGHFESQWQHELCKRIVKSLTDQG